MLRFFVASTVLACVSVASAQTIYEPPTQPEVYNPFYKNLNEQAIKRLWVLSQHWCMAAPGSKVGMIPGESYSSNNDPNYFRKGQLAGAPRAAEPEMAPEPAYQPGEHAGEVSIRPYKPHGKQTTVDTSGMPANPAEKGKVIITPAKR